MKGKKCSILKVWFCTAKELPAIYDYIYLYLHYIYIILQFLDAICGLFHIYCYYQTMIKYRSSPHLQTSVKSLWDCELLEEHWLSLSLFSVFCAIYLFPGSCLPLWSILNVFALFKKTWTVVLLCTFFKGASSLNDDHSDFPCRKQWRRNWSKIKWKIHYCQTHLFLFCHLSLLYWGLVHPPYSL